MQTHSSIPMDLVDARQQELGRSRFPGKTPAAQLNSRLLERDRAGAGYVAAAHNRRLLGVGPAGRRLAAVFAGFRHAATAAADARAEIEPR